MASLGQKWGGCGHLMAGFDTHSCCARCPDKGKGPDPYVEKPENSDCKLCNILTSDQRFQLSSPSYKLKKETCEAKKTDITATLLKKHCQSLLCGPGICVGNRGSGWSGDVTVYWFKWSC